MGDTDRQDILTSLSEMTKRMMESLQELENQSSSNSDHLEQEQTRRRKSEEELVMLRAKLETELHKLDDCHKEIDIYRYQLEEANKSVDSAKEDINELKVKKEAEYSKMKNELEQKIMDLTDTFKNEQKELKQALELEHELELDNFKEKVNKEDSDQVSTLLASIGDLEQKLQNQAKEMEDRLEEKDKEIEKQIEMKEKELNELMRSQRSVSSESFKSDRTELMEAEFN